ncbi:MAG TPA: hypothetical protein VKQ08_06030 [Cyclobacteriaceae bacterium]|nr:hypothetical protein [Cyclobacteriaceae bacterium]
MKPTRKILSSPKKKRTASRKARAKNRTVRNRKSAKRKSLARNPESKAKGGLQMTSKILDEQFVTMAKNERNNAFLTIGPHEEGEFELQSVGCCRYRVDGVEHCDTLTRNQCAAIPNLLPDAILISFTRSCTCAGDSPGLIRKI